MELIKPGKQYDFMGKRWLFIGLSLVLLVLSALSFVYPGPRLGTDFKGGTEIEVAFTAPVDAGEIRAALTKEGVHDADIVSVGAPGQNQFLIRVQEVTALSEAQKTSIRGQLCFAPDPDDAPDDARCPKGSRATEVKLSPGGDKISVRFEGPPDLSAVKSRLAGIDGVELRQMERNPNVVSERDHKVEVYLKSRGDQLMDSLRQQLGADKVPAQALRVEWIGPKAGAQLRDAAIKSVLVALVFIMAYVAFRFDVRFAPGGILALVHDVGIALGAMVLTGREITLSTVAALLTIVGYSITDTVVVYDRIRENVSKHRHMSFREIINLSVSEMLGRTIITSSTVLLSLVAFLFWGTSVIKDFAFALIVGVVVGTYSSIYIAAPLTEWIDRKFFAAKAARPKKVVRTRTAKRADAVV